MNIFCQLLKFADLPEYLRQLGASDEVVDFVLSQPDEYKEYYLRAVRKNPQISVDELANISLPIQQNIDPILLAKEQYPNLSEQIDYLVQSDPSGNQRYLLWEIAQVDKGNHLEDIIPTVNFFHRNLQKFEIKDINKYQDLKDLENLVKEIGSQEFGRQIRQQAKGEAKKLYEDDTYVLIRPDTKDACVLYGKNTKWCITMRDESYYEQYTGSNVVFYFLINKKLDMFDPMSKIAFAIQRSFDNKQIKEEIFNAQDNQINSTDVPNYDQIKNIINSDIIRVPKSILAKAKDGQATEEELDQYLSLLDNKSIVQIFQDINFEKYSNIAKKYLAKLSNDEDKYVRRSVASNPSTPAEILAKLSNDEDIYVRRSVASNPSTPAEILAKLSNDEDIYVRRTVVSNKSTPAEILVQLSKDEDYIVRRNIASNPSTPAEILVQLSNDEDIYIRNWAKNNLRNKVKIESNNRLEQLKKLGVIVERSKGYFVESEKGRNLGGPYKTKEKTQKRLNEVEMFKHMKKKKALENLAKDLKIIGEDEMADKVVCALAVLTGAKKPKTEYSYSYMMRKLRKDDKDKLEQFQKSFKNAFDDALENGFADDAHNMALMHAMNEIGFEG